MRPFFPYYGSKWNIVKHYPAPEHETVIEPFAGSASYATRHNAHRAILVDLDPVVCAVWSYLITATADEIDQLPELPNAGDTVLDHNLEPGARYLIGFWLNRGSAVPKLTRTEYSTRTDRAQLNWGRRAKDRIIEQLPGIRRWAVIEGDYRCASSIPDATFFVDPPYGIKGRHYRQRFTEYDQLGKWCEAQRGQVIVCEGEGADWLPFEHLGHFKTTNGSAPELVWTNR